MHVASINIDQQHIELLVVLFEKLIEITVYLASP